MLFVQIGMYKMQAIKYFTSYMLINSKHLKDDYRDTSEEG